MFFKNKIKSHLNVKHGYDKKWIIKPIKYRINVIQMKYFIWKVGLGAACLLNSATLFSQCIYEPAGQLYFVVTNQTLSSQNI